MFEPIRVMTWCKVEFFLRILFILTANCSVNVDVNDIDIPDEKIDSQEIDNQGEVLIFQISSV